MSGAGLYVHVPFCSTLCPYCDFAVVVGKTHLHERYCEAVVAEAESAAPGWGEFATLFVGGGTPSAIAADLLARTLDRLRAILRFAGWIEATVESNPESVDASSLRRLRDAGVNRLSIGAQSFRNHVLRALGRTHDAAAVARAVTAARTAGFDNVSLDLIYGAPGETDDDWDASVRAAVALGVEHVSCYALTIEDRTLFGRAVARGRMTSPDDDVLAARFEAAASILAASGYEHYEVSNWSRRGRACRHNVATWRQGDYLGLGLGAHSHRAGHRWWNPRSLARYLDDPARPDREERLSGPQRAEEWVSLGLRLAAGIGVAEASQRLGRDIEVPARALAATGLVTLQDGRISLSTRGMLLENEVTARLLERPLALSTSDC